MACGCKGRKKGRGKGGKISKQLMGRVIPLMV